MRYLFPLMFASQLVYSANCLDQKEVIKFDDPLLTRRCEWFAEVEQARSINAQHEVIFLGDSLIAGGEFKANYGMGGDTIPLIMTRLDIVLNANPKKVYLWVGINDFYRDASSSKTIELYKELIHTLQTHGIAVTVLSTLKCNASFDKPICIEANPKIDALNYELSRMPTIRFVDLNSKLSNSNGIKAEYTTDGIHLNALGYKQVYGLI